ncbi:LysR family transcriptional regulator [Zoogloea oleivorans]|jgi:DNA-binding transcriptional LysR family regulator|uniref:LysR family transcriptional regulator n=4 Tax=Rhodocyclales TaxID=206389 RepID=A0A6C2D696_9RHOO|nr:LysR family transcriptional regulator [Zoogloea oleivorans]
MASMSAPSQSSILKLAVSADALSPQLATLLALQRAEEPETLVLLQEVTAGDLVRGLENGDCDMGMAVRATSTHLALDTQPLWGDELALAVPLRSPLLAHVEVSLDALLHYPLVRWCPRACEALSQQVDAVIGPEDRSAREVNSFELMALLVAAGYGVGIAPRSRIAQARGWGVAMRPLADGPYLIRTQLLLPSRGCVPAVERFAERAAKITETRSA